MNVEERGRDDDAGSAYTHNALTRHGTSHHCANQIYFYTIHSHIPHSAQPHTRDTLFYFFNWKANKRGTLHPPQRRSAHKLIPMPICLLTRRRGERGRGTKLAREWAGGGRECFGRREIRNLRTILMQHQNGSKWSSSSSSSMLSWWLFCGGASIWRAERQRLKTFATKCNGLVDNLFCQKT